MNQATRYAKAIVAFATTLSGAAGTIAADGKVTALEVIVAACAVLVATAGVWAFPNQPPAGEPSDPAMSEQDPIAAA